MRNTSILPLVLLSACTAVPIDTESALAARRLEMTVDARGAATEVEYHVSPDEVPAAVREAMDRLHPGGDFTGAERETLAGVLYYELARLSDGFEVEAMFRPDGTLHAEEISVPPDEVPGAVREAARAAVPGARVTAWEEIRDGQRALVEYHVKLRRHDDRYKVVLSVEGGVRRVLREMDAEIEVPLPS